MEKCVFCDQSVLNGDPTVKLRAKGSESINRASEQRGSAIRTTECQTVHQECRRIFTNPNNIAADLRDKAENISDGKINNKRKLRCASSKFDCARDCLFCGQPGKFDWKAQSFNTIPVRTEKQFQDTIRNVCRDRDDAWALQVLSRLEYARDCFAMDMIYHATCSVNFRTRKQIPRMCSNDLQEPVPNKVLRVGRPEDCVKRDAFLDICKYLEDNDNEQTTVCDLVHKMKKDFPNVEPYSVPYMKMKLVEHFGSKITFAGLNGKSDVMTFTSNASQILHDFHHSPRHEDAHSEKVRLIQAAADLIKADIKSTDVSKKSYPTFDDISSLEKNLKFLPDSLQIFLQKLFVSTDSSLKVASIGQCIMQATRPRVIIAPLCIGLGVQLHHHYASKFLIDSLYRHGYCSSYSEVKKFEMNAAAYQTTDIPGFIPGDFVQFVADNLDHNVRTIDGFNTFHGMGIIGTSTPGRQASIPIPRERVNSDDIKTIGRIGVHFHKAKWSDMTPLLYEEILMSDNCDPTASIDFLWKVMWPLKSPRPAWSGMMQTVYNGTDRTKSSVIYLPMIDMNPSDASCIYTTLKFIAAEARKYNVAPIVTFDQPLWWKAQTIIANEPSDSDLGGTVLRLGAFHIQMSFLGCIGHLMAGSGLQEVLEAVYAPNTVDHMMSGKAVSRAVRGHFLVDTALNTLIVASAFRDPWETVSKVSTELECPSAECVSESKWTGERIINNNDLGQVVQIYNSIMDGNLSVEEACKKEVLHSVASEVEKYKQSVKGNPTSALWLLYMDMLDILRRFIKAERLGIWKLHLHSLSEMLPFFAASGHNLYAKSARLYLQNMHKLEEKNHHVFQCFENGLHSLHRSERDWGGIPTDLMIEQSLMRSAKSTGGLTRGKGIGEMQRLIWVLSMPACSAMNAGMQTVTNVNFHTTEQHKEMTKTRLNRDHDDTVKILQFLEYISPFEDAGLLRNIVTGANADSLVNVVDSVKVGQKIMDSMTGEDALHFSFKRKDKVITLAAKLAVKIDEDKVQVNPQVLFQRLITTAEHQHSDLTSVFKYELSSTPLALFDSSGLPLHANKAALADVLWAMLENPDWQLPKVGASLKYVLDGGALLQRVVWPNGTTYQEILQLYIEYVTGRYREAIVVFDGYESGLSIKDITHLRRKRFVGRQVDFTSKMKLCSNKEEFLANEVNKQKFIYLLGKALSDNGCTVHHTNGDADVPIVQAALDSAKQNTTVLIGEDTDLLVLLCHHANLDSDTLFFTSEQKLNVKKKVRVWNIKSTKDNLGHDICSNLLFAHAFSGCDTTSRLFGISKGAIVKKIKGNTFLQTQASIFSKPSPKSEVIAAGELVALYNGGSEIELDALRKTKFCEKVAKSRTVVHAQTLPPTSAAAKYHSLRVYYQVREWMNNRPNSMQPEEWGWEIRNERLSPILTDILPAPENLLRNIRCTCKTGCFSSKCGCRKYGLECTPACSECRGVSCTNSMKENCYDSDEGNSAE